ncbi:MAG: prepilin-type N-terminal cleavage/methylation domain-containing protein [Bermanella sp.]
MKILQKNNSKLKVELGFTLIEIIIVIVVLSVLSIGSAKFISFSAQGYVDTVRRSGLASSASIVNEKISRMVRDSLPGSVRVNAAQDCLELVPVVAASRYVQAPIVGYPVSQTEVHAVPVDAALAQAGYLAIYPVTEDINEIYDGTTSPGIISNNTATITGTSNGASVFTFDVGATFQYSQGSPQQRLFITDTPVAFCQDGSNLFFYRNYGFVGDVANLAAALPTAIPNRLLVATDLQAGSVVFSILEASLRRNAIVAYEFEFENSISNESLVINQEVQIRNVP